VFNRVAFLVEKHKNAFMLKKHYAETARKARRQSQNYKRLAKSQKLFSAFAPNPCEFNKVIQNIIN
jgi:hypothetical protein